METVINAELTLEEVQFILNCINTYPFTTTIQQMPQISAMAGNIARKLTPKIDKKE